jgi:hypothetical protein
LYLLLPLLPLPLRLLQWGTYAAPYGAEKAKMNALMSMIDSELALAGITGVSVQVGTTWLRRQGVLFFLYT